MNKILLVFLFLFLKNFTLQKPGIPAQYKLSADADIEFLATRPALLENPRDKGSEWAYSNSSRIARPVINSSLKTLVSASSFNPPQKSS